VSESIRLTGFVDDRRISRFQYAAVALCGTVMFLDGFDTQVVNYLAPHIARDWGLSTAVLGPIFSSALVGLMIGYLVLSPLSDRFGHRRLVIAGTAVFALTSLASVWVGGVTELVLLRLVTGIGLGAAAPSAVALTAEYSPKRVRASFVLAIYCGFSLGFVAAGLVTGWLEPAFGWRSVFLVGALAPMVIIPVMLRFLPESLAFLTGRGADPGRAYQLCRRIDRTLPVQVQPVLVDPTEAGGRVKLRAVLANGGILGTVLLWVVFAVNLGEFYALQSWLPTMLTDLGFAGGTVVSATSLITVGGIAVALVVGPAMDRLGAFGSLAVLFVVGAVFLAVTGPAFAGPEWVMLSALFLVGCGVSGGQKALIALAAVVYPASVRSTGVGWALGIGRLGGILGPLVVGAALSANWSPTAVFLALAGPMLVCAGMIVHLGRRARRAATTPAPEPVGPR